MASPPLLHSPSTCTKEQKELPLRKQILKPHSLFVLASPPYRPCIEIRFWALAITKQMLNVGGL